MFFLSSAICKPPFRGMKKASPQTGQQRETSFQKGVYYIRIGFFINQYFEVGLTDTKVSFKNIWKEQLIDGNGQVYFTIPKPIMNTHSDNPLVKAMYWLQKDFYERKEINVTTPHAERIFQMRNDIEHNCLRTGTQSHNTSFTKYTTEGKIENNTFRLLKLARELIIYLCLAVNFDREKDKRASMEE